jgi:hypothetical protein
MPAESGAITLVVEAPAAPAPPVGQVGGLIDVVRKPGAGGSSLPTWGIGIGGGLVLVLFTAWLMRRRRRRTRGVVGSYS